MAEVEIEFYSPKTLAQHMMEATAAHPLDGQYVYFIRCEQFVKIGHSVSPARRLPEMASHTPFPLELLKVIQGSVAAEKAIHNLLSEFAHQGEWFRLEQRLLSAVEQLPGDEVPAKWGRRSIYSRRGFPTEEELRKERMATNA